MPRRTTLPYFQAPGRCMLDDLPAELLHHMFSLLETRDILSARATCSLLAAVGADHILEEVGLIFHRERFHALVDIAQHPVFSKRAKSLYFQGDRYDDDASYAEWDKSRSDPDRLGRWVDEMPGLEPSFSDRYGRALLRSMKKSATFRRGNFSGQEIEAAYQAYLRLVEDQKAIVKEGLDASCLASLFEGCPKLDCVSLVFSQASRRYLARGATTFRNATVYPYGDSDWQSQGVEQMGALTKALCSTKRALDSLSVIEVSHRIFKQSRDALQQMRDVFRPLRRLRLVIQTWSQEDDDPAEEVLLEEASEHFESGVLRDLLSDSLDLRVLKLHFPMGIPGRGIDAVAGLEDVIGDITWPHLLEVVLVNISATEDDFVDLLLRHKATLRRMSFSQIVLERGTWDSAFQRIGGKLLNLREVTLRGHFDSVNMGREYDFDTPGAASRKIAPLRDAVENHILKGGEWPDIENTPWQLPVYPWEDPDYVPPGLPDDDPDPDDPDLRYEWDEFDDMM